MTIEAQHSGDFASQPGDVVAKEHWAQSGFANTDLDQQLRQHRITHVIVVGLPANTYIESTARYILTTSRILELLPNE